MSLLQQPQIKGIGPTTLGNPFSQFLAPTAPEPVVPNITPRKPPVDLSQGATMEPMSVTQPKLPQGIPEPYTPTMSNQSGFEGTTYKPPAVKKDQYGQNQPEAGSLGAFEPSDLISGIKETGTSIKNTMNETGNFFQNKAPGLDQAKQNGRFLTHDHLTNKITTAIQQMPDATDEEIALAIGQLKNEGFIFEGMNDKNFNNPVTNFLGDTPLGFGTDLIGGVSKMAGNFVGGTLEGGAQMSEGMVDVMEGNTNKGMSKVVGGATDYGLNIMGGMFPGVSSVFNTETAQPVIENTLVPLQEGIQENIVNKGLDLTGMDPNSEEYQNYSNALSTIGTILTTMGIAKTGQIGFRETFGTNLNYNNTTVKDFVKNTGKTASDFEIAVKTAKPDLANAKISNNTPISKIFTPEEYAQFQAMAQNNGATGLGRREGLISDATQAKVKEKLTSGLNMAKKRVQADEATPKPIMEGENNAINSEGVQGVVPKPGIKDNIQDVLFDRKSDASLAQGAIRPRNVRGKPTSDKINSGIVALNGIQQLHDDSIAGHVKADIGTLEGGMIGIEEALEHHGKIIGENADPNEIIPTNDVLGGMQEALKSPIAEISGPVKGLAESLVKMMDRPELQEGISMKDTQDMLSLVKSRIRGNPELRSALQSDPIGRQVSAFIDELSNRYDKAMEEGGNGALDKSARQAYTNLSKVKNDIIQSGLVNARNTPTGQSGFVGRTIATYELLQNGISGIPVAMGMKYIGETKGEYNTRGGQWAKLIRNLDRKAIQRTEGQYNTGDKSKYTPKPTPKTPKPTPKAKPNDGINSSVPPDSVDMAGAKGTPIPRSDIPGATRTKIEVPGNPKGNISNKLAGNKGVIVPKNPNMIEDTSKILPSGDRMHKEEVKQVERDLNTALKSKYNPDKPKATKTFIESAIAQGKITKEEGIVMVEKLYEDANGFDKPHYEKLLNDLYSNKSESFDDILNEKQENKPTISPRKEYLENNPEGMYERINKLSNDKRYSPDKANKLIEEFKEKTGWDLMENPNPVFDKDGQIVKGKSDITPKPNKIIGLTSETANAYKGETGGGIKNVEPGKQVKYNQGDYYEPVRMALTQKDADIARFGSLSRKQMKSSVTENESREMSQIRDRLKMTNAELEMRAQELRDIAKNARSKTESVLVDLRETPEITPKSEKYRTADDMNNTQLTTKILKGLGDRETVSKEFIQNMTNSGDVKQIEKDIIRGLMESEGDKVNVADFKKKVQAELLPLTTAKPFNPNRYERVSLPSETRGRVKNYKENIYESPIETSAGNTHFGTDTKNYFGHTRIEDMENGTRRVIEVQSDLFQKGRLEKEIDMKPSEYSGLYGKTDREMMGNKSKTRLLQYNDPTAHFRMIREEVSQAVKDGVKELQFPTGETAMKIEGLGDDTKWFKTGRRNEGLKEEELKVGMNVSDYGLGDEDWIITDVLGNGRFRAIYKKDFEGIKRAMAGSRDLQISDIPDEMVYKEIKDKRLGEETFDISGKTDQSNPIYKFYEKEVGRYLKNKYDAKLVTDDKGVSWYQVDVKDSMGGPVEAFRTDITPKITAKITPEQKIELQDLNKRFFGDDSIQIVDKIESNGEALGSYKDGMIKIVDGQGKPLDTLHHEAVHKYLDVFATNSEAKAILEYGKQKYKDSDYANVEEKIAEDFIKYAKDRSGFTGSIRKLFDSIIDRIRAFLGNGDKIQKMYRDIMKGKAKKVDLGIKPKEEKFRTDITPKIKPSK